MNHIIQMKKTLILGLLAACAVGCHAAGEGDDPVIMTVNGKPVLKSEFEYSYRKNNGEDVIDHKTVKEYVELFANYKRKVEAALEAHLDTLSSYQQEFRQYRDQQVLPTIISEADVDNEARVIYQETKDRIGPDGLVSLQHILLRVGQNDSESVKQSQAQRADSVYQALMNGADFSELARRVSQDPGSAPSGGELPWLSKGQTLPAFDAAAFALKEGEISRPVLTEVGYHVIKMKARKQLEPYEEVKNDIYQFIEKREIRESIARNRVKAMAEGSGKTEQQIMDESADSISAINQDMKYLIKEYHDGLLLYEISNREVWEKASKDEPGLQVFYNKNKKKYKWDEPRFKGIAYHTRDAKDVEAVKKCLKKEPFSKWADILRTTFNNDSVLRIRAEKGIFKKGDNGLVDKEQFKVADAKVKEIKDFPYTSTYGKMLKGPEEMDDVRGLVVGDYQDSMEKAWVEQLKKRYPVSVDEKVLSTVKADK